ncbi:Gamma-tubulin complex component 3 [Zea mays]|uniref:Gamma-tubulin complex component 3 n=1 Tax=Zea mays TaxID=4577 RepID=A0A1D6I5I7_MAIZE|nr:Gamma-tubulin complex component 3 [Zea mays]
MEWLCFRLDMLSSFVFSFTLILLVSSPSALIDPETAGLAVTYGLSLNMLQGWAIAVLCSLENRMISVERMLQYTTIPSEPPLTISERQPNRQWPTKGEIKFLNLHVCLFNAAAFCSKRPDVHLTRRKEDRYCW